MMCVIRILPRRRIQKTRYIAVNTRKCRGCWQCIEVCPNNVLTKLSFLSHNHIRLKNPQNCTGCLRCVKACSTEALTICSSK